MTEVTVKAKIEKGYQQEIKAGDHTIIADVPKASGGQETGPNPHELLLASLGACTSVTLQMFAKKREWDIKELTVKLSEESVEDPKEPGKKISKITRHIHVAGNLDAEQLETLKTIADKCQIHKLLIGSKEIKTEVSPASRV